jgi:hypothetical protein
METWGWLATVTVAELDLVGSAALVAVTVKVPAADGALYIPVLLIVPADAAQFTAVLLAPVTVAVNCAC